jgi:hypothetical protein
MGIVLLAFFDYNRHRKNSNEIILSYIIYIRHSLSFDEGMFFSQ